MTEPPLELVTLTERETIVARGHRKVVWFVQVHRSWEPAGSCAGGTRSEVTPGPGTVWEREIELRVPRDTVLLRVDSQPRLGPPRDALEYLQRETRRAERHVRRTLFRVGPRGVLTRLEPSS